jgi:all-trans-retinol 13,14-reductase
LDFEKTSVMQENKHYDFIILGSGMGGLTAAAVLAKNGYQVLVLEKNHQIGGSLQVFSRDKCVFDTGVHYIGGLDEGENLYQLFNYLEIYPQLKLKRLDDKGYDLIRFNDGTSYLHGQGYENFQANLIEQFPEEEGAIIEFCKKIKEICAYFPLYNLEEGDDKSTTYINDPEILAIGAWDYVSALTSNERLKNVLLGSGPLYAASKTKTPLYEVALIMNSYLKGSYRPIDGGSQIAKAMSKTIRKYKGEIIKHKHVTGAEFNENGTIKSVHCKDGSSFTATNFISNIHPAVTLQIFGKENFKPAFYKRIQRLENTISAFMVYITFKKDAFEYLNYNSYEFFSDDTWSLTEYQGNDWPQMLFVCTPATSKSKKYAESMSVMSYLESSSFEEWQNTYNTISEPMDRGTTYEVFKKEKEALILAKIEARYPGIKEKIRNVYSSSPITYRDYIGSPDGSLYGIAKDYNKVLATTINSKTSIPNLTLTGQNIVFHGILGVTISGFVTSFEYVDKSKILNEINNHEL